MPSAETTHDSIIRARKVMQCSGQLMHKKRDFTHMLSPKRICMTGRRDILKFLGGVLGTMTTASNNRVLTKAHRDFSCGLSRFANTKVHDKDLSDDLVQETFIKTWKYLQGTGKINLMRAFLYHVLNRLIIDEYRRKKAVSLDVLIESGFELQAIDF